MEHGAHENLEHAEHAEHAAHNPFDRRVAMTITIIAAAVAVVSMLSHRGHNETLLLQAKATDAWNLYQAKTIRDSMYQSTLLSQVIQGKEPDKDDQSIKGKAWVYLIGEVDKYEGKKYWENLVASGFKPKREGGKKIRGGQLAELQGEAKHLEEESEHIHHNVDWLDYGNLGLEFGLILCSVAVLTKQRSFWFGGILVAVGGLGIACIGIYGMYLAPH